MTGGYRRGYVFVQNNFAGMIEETDEGYIFSYTTDYLEKENALAVSLTMPLDNRTYKSAVLFPFFDGLIPEGWLLGIVNRHWKIDLQDRFGLLLAVCKDGSGDVSIKSEEEYEMFILQERNQE